MKYLPLYILFLGVILSSSCNRHRHDPYPYYAYPVIPDTNRFHLPYTNPSVNGYTKYYYPGTGILSSEGNYENGTPTGYWKFYYSNGMLMREGNFSNGQLSGYWKFYYSNGLLKEEGNYSNGIPTGYWKYYYANGHLSAEGNYSNGIQQGAWKYYYVDGSLEMTTTY